MKTKQLFLILALGVFLAACGPKQGSILWPLNESASHSPGSVPGSGPAVVPVIQNN